MAIIAHTTRTGRVSYYVDFRDQKRKRRTEWGGSTMEEARQTEARIIREVSDGTYVHRRYRNRLETEGCPICGHIGRPNRLTTDGRRRQWLAAYVAQHSECRHACVCGSPTPIPPSEVPSEVRVVQAIAAEGGIAGSPWVSSRALLENASAVYLLYKGPRLQYVGKAVNVFSRVRDHLYQKDFDHFVAVSMPESAIEGVERAAIYALNPPLNVLGKRK